MAATTTTSGYPHTGLLWAFFTLHVIGGHFLMPVLFILTTLRKTVNRNYVFLNFCFTWIVYSITFCLLLYTGEQTGPTPAWKICRTQAALVYAVPILVAMASFTLVLSLWLDIRAPSDSKVVPRTFFSLRNILLIGLPYIFAAGYLIGPSVVAITARKTISRNNALFYCSSNLRALTIVSATSVGVIFLATVIFEILIARILHQRTGLQQIKGTWWEKYGFFTRIALFTAYLLCSVAACGLQIARPSSPVRLIVDAMGPLVVFVVFGSTPALYRRSHPSSNVASRTSRTSDKSTTALYQPVTTSA
ncbi:hypothetical protein CPB86DRAFT_787385 [Serendipita vermifera]|nr:hypothetical protein CPB86DRAFT_787385 [Serendipita vermifera]